jgi:phytoene synthase
MYNTLTQSTYNGKLTSIILLGKIERQKFIMSMQENNWESHLNNLAYEALHECIPEEVNQDGKKRLEEAYSHCGHLTRFHSKTFSMASRFLPAEKQPATNALYAFCRVSDDLVDQWGSEHPEILQAWKNKSLNHFSNQDISLTIQSDPSQHYLIDTTEYNEDLVALAWADTCHNFNIPCKYAEQLIDGVALDFQKNRYESFDELAGYCYGVACTVGLMAMHIIGYESPDAIPYAIRLGIALQLTNILRDIGEDWRMGRLYLPQQELEAFGITEEHIDNGIVDQRWQDFMKFQIKRARKLYAESKPGIKILDPQGRFAITAAAQLYEGILDDIEAHEYQVFTRRAHLSNAAKLRRLPAIWYQAKF